MQPHDAVVSCSCRFAVPAKFRGKINLSNKAIVYVNALGATASGPIRGVDNYLFQKLTQKGRGQLGGFDDREFIDLELVVFWGMRIIKGSLFERDVSADEVNQPAVLLVEVLNKL